MSLTVISIPAFDDNYIWLLRGEGPRCLVVDPGDDEPVSEYLEANGLELAGILITHKHGDHTGGVGELRERWPGIPVFGPANERINGVDRPVAEGERIRVDGIPVELTVWDVPGHTEGHVAYLGEGMLFCGDTLFGAGCGRVFSGTFEQLSDALARIASLPPETQIYCAHEYTLCNLGFATWVEPDNEVIVQRMGRVVESRQHHIPTAPFTLSEELETNPFLRTSQPAVIAAAERWAGTELPDRRAVFKALRQWKDSDYD